MTTLLMLLACAQTPAVAEENEGTQAAPALVDGQAEAIFAMGCFWCAEKDLEKVEGVIDAVSGYTGGKEPNPTYEQVGYHKTSHIEAIRVIYDPTKVSYDHLLTVFWTNIDPAQSNGQFCDRGEQYRSAIFVSDPDQKALAEQTKVEVAKELGITVDTRILPVSTFWVAEEYHQDFYKKSADHYTRYRTGCGRDAQLKKVWGDKANTH